MKDIYFQPVVKKPNIPQKLIKFTSHWLTLCCPYLSVLLAKKLLGNPFSRRVYTMRTEFGPLSIMLKTSMGEVCLHTFKREETEHGKNVFLCHGWGDTSTRFTQLINHLLKQGHTVYSLDQVGHGASQGNYSDLYGFIEGTTQALEYMCAQGCAADVVIGHSMGALGVMNQPVEILEGKKIVLISAPALYFENMHNAVVSVGISKLMLTNLLERVSLQRETDWQTLAESHNVHKVAAKSLFIHDTSDTICPYTDTKNLVKGLEHTFYSTHNLGHTQLLKDIGLLNRVSSFVESELTTKTI